MTAMTDVDTGTDADPSTSTETETSDTERSYWRYSAFDLTGDCTVTIAALCFPLTPWLYQAIAERLDYFPVSRNKACFLLWMIVFVYVEIAMHLTMNLFRIISRAAICSSRMGCALEYSLDFVAFICSLFLCAVAVALRQRARRDNAIQGRCLPEEDVCLSVFCLPCSLIQVAREVNAGPDVAYCVIPDASDHAQTTVESVQTILDSATHTRGTSLVTTEPKINRAMPTGRASTAEGDRPLRI